MKPTNCRHCGRVSPGHYCRDIAPGETMPCIALARQRNVKQSNARVRRQSANLNSGKDVGRHNKELATRLEKLTVRSRREVAQILGCSVEGVRRAELSAMEKVKKLLMPFRGAISGEAKIKQVTQPIASLSD